MKKIVPIFMACLVFCSVGGATVSAAVPPDNGSVVSPCYLYTDSVNCNLNFFHVCSSIFSRRMALSIMRTRHMDEKTRCSEIAAACLALSSSIPDVGPHVKSSGR